MMRHIPRCVIRSLEDVCAFSSISHDIIISCFLTSRSFEAMSTASGAWMNDSCKGLGQWWVLMNQSIQNAVLEDQQCKKEVQVIPSIGGNGSNIVGASNIPRVVLSPIGSLNRDVDDVRRITDAVRAGISRAIKTGKCVNPLIIFPDLCLLLNKSKQVQWEDLDKALSVACLASMVETYRPPSQFQSMNHNSANGTISSITLALPQKYLEKTGIDIVEPGSLKGLVSGQNHLWESLTPWIESGRQLARDIGSGDPEFMSPKNCAKEIQEFFKKNVPSVSVQVIDRLDLLSKDYPLLHAVSRASLHVERHHPCVVKLEYDPAAPSGDTLTHLYLVGKGICYDTGGADLKVGGAMIGMSRDKCGAAAVAGFLAVVGQAKPSHLRVSASLAFVRNSIGSDSYVSDEIIQSRAGLRVRVGNTDAEGRMVMTDLLAEMKERALAQSKVSTKESPILMTCATLTGHAGRAMGPYPICIDNWPAKQRGVSKHLSKYGSLYGEPWEVSNLRKEDYNMNVPTTGTGREDLVQCNSQPSTMTARGHQFPAAFMLAASGLDKHSIRVPSESYLEDLATKTEGESDSIFTIPYTHMDIAAAAEEPGPCGKLTGTPIVTLTASFLLHPLQ
jgi:leucyl aminopeptidase